MNRTVIAKTLLLSFVATLASAQLVDLSQVAGWDDLAAKASEKVNVNLEGPLLSMASQFLSDKKSDEAGVKRLVTNLKGIQIRSLEFDKPDQYTKADVVKLRSLFKSPTWTVLVDVQEKNEQVGVFVRYEGNLISGLAIVSAENRELTVVQLAGTLNPEDLSSLGGSFNIPRLDLAPKPAPRAEPKKKD